MDHKILNPSVHILATCRNPELFRATTLVFDSIRVGFPKADVFVYGNALESQAASDIDALCELHGLKFVGNGNPTVHHDWIRGLILREARPFIICDTDVVFFGNMEGIEFRGPIHGRLVPQFRCPFTGTITHERIHTSLMLIDPDQIRMAVRIMGDQVNPKNPFKTPVSLVAPLIYPLNSGLYMHDTMGRVFHSIGGHWFKDDELSSFSHLNAGTYSDLMDEKIPGFRERQEVMMRHPESTRGLWRKQNEWYKAHAA